MKKTKKRLQAAALFTLLLTIMVSVSFRHEAQAAGDDSGDGALKIIGRVVSVDGPVVNARVRIPGQLNFVLTDKQGRYSLTWPIEFQYKAQFSLGKGRQKPLVIAAGKKGYFNNSATVGRSGLAGDIYLRPVYMASQPNYKFNSPQVCYQCHTKLTLLWNKSKMAHTTTNKKLRDMYYGTDSQGKGHQGPGYRLDNPKDEGDCVNCHAPSSVATNMPTKDLNKILQSGKVEWDGVSCDYCHKIRSVYDDPSSPSGKTAILEKQAPTTGRSILVFGPYDDVIAPPMAASYNPLIKSARLCSVCHSHLITVDKGKEWDRKKIYSDEEWKGFEFENDRILPIQTTYQEWKLWQDGLPEDDPNQGKTCQKCHLSWQKSLLPYYNHIVDDNARKMWGTFRQPEDIRPHHFEGSTPAQLANALAMEIKGEIITDKGKGRLLKIKTFVSNSNGGHWVPTGEPMRNVLLLVTAQDEDGKPLKLLQGSRLPEWAGVGDKSKGDYAGEPGAIFARVLADAKGNLNVPSWRATTVAADTRIRPKKTVVMEFIFALPDGDSEPEAIARLIYRPVVRPLAKQKKWQVEDVLITEKAW